MILTWYPYQLQFKYPFRIFHGIRTHTSAVFVKLEHKGCVGWGEATLPPYLPETQESVIEFCKNFSLKASKESMESWTELLAILDTNMSAKAALDVALWNLKASVNNTSIGKLLQIENDDYPLCTYTLGVSDFTEMQMKVADAEVTGFKIFKLKLNGDNDETIVRNFKKLSSSPFAVDVNQGWQTEYEALNKIEWLKKEGCILVEQPLHRSKLKEMTAIKQKSALPVYADESCQRLTDVEVLQNCFHGINIKLMKCGGITEARQMITEAQQIGLKILVGCMSESSVGCTAAAQLTPLANYADLDGPYLISNNPFKGMIVKGGKIQAHPLEQINAL